MFNKNNNQPIGIFDSGLGGLTVLRALKQLLPNENFVYLGDTARVPYGGRSPHTILQYSCECASFLQEHNIKLLVIACNTASSYAANHLRNTLNIPVVDVVFPSVQSAIQVTSNQHICVLGTRATVLSGIYQKLIKDYLPAAHVTAIPCPLLVHLVEENFINHEATALIIKDYLKPLDEIVNQGITIDTLILGCTHYPLLQKQIQRVLGSQIHILDSASACARSVFDVLINKGLVNLCQSEVGNVHFFVSDDPEKFRRLGQNFLDQSLPFVNLIPNWHDRAGSGMAVTQTVI